MAEKCLTRTLVDALCPGVMYLTYTRERESYLEIPFDCVSLREQLFESPSRASSAFVREEIRVGLLSPVSIAVATMYAINAHDDLHRRWKTTVVSKLSHQNG